MLSTWTPNLNAPSERARLHGNVIDKLLATAPEEELDSVVTLKSAEK
jgi:hypothetical protein